MHVYLDTAALGERTTLRNALALACDQADRSGRIVVDAMLDGAAVDPAHVEARADDHGTRLDVASANPVELARTALSAAATRLDQVRIEHQASAAALRDGRIDDAMAPLGDALRAWDQCRTALDQSAALLGLDASSASGWNPEPLKDRLEELKRSLSHQDWAGVADVLEYDMDTQADALAAGLRRFSDRLERA